MPRQQHFDSGSPTGKVRGNSYQLFEKYMALARDAQSAGDRIATENYLQHAEHYHRLMNLAGEGGQPRPNFPRPYDGRSVSDRMRDGEGENGQDQAPDSPGNPAGSGPTTA